MTARDRIIIGVVVFAAALAAYWFLVLAPAREEAGRLAGQIAEQEKRRDSAQAAMAQGRSAQVRYAGDYATVARLGKAVPVDDDVPSLIYEIESAADRSRVDFLSLIHI